ncbi:putative ribonuclease H-like domain-containing protein, partial [Tanacetum coccineum]
SQILGDLASPVMTRSRAQKSKFGESAFIGYIQDQQRTYHTDQLHCQFACFLSQLEPSSIAKALEDHDWVAAMQEEMQQFINQKVWKLSHGDRKSTTGGCQFLGRRLISWQCKKQTIVATSSTEAEYVAAASCCAQVLWIQNTKIFINNQSTICIVKNPVFHQRTKHIEIRHHFIRDANEKNLIQELKIHTDMSIWWSILGWWIWVCVRAVCMVSAVGWLFLLAEYIHAAGIVYAVITSIYAGELVCAGSIMFLLAALFLLVVTCFCCAQFDIAGWLVSATSHFVSAGSLQSCWCHNVSAA